MTRTFLALATLLVLVAQGLFLAEPPDAPAGGASPAAEDPLHNPAIDMEAHLRLAQEAARHRATRRLSEEDFLRMAGQENTIILDARSREAYALLHVEGAVNLPFPDIAIESMARLIPDKQTRILIYCNNNFRNEERAFASKLAPVSLNLSTYTTLYTYGYRNIYELGPRMNVEETKLPLVSGRQAAVAPE